MSRCVNTIELTRPRAIQSNRARDLYTISPPNDAVLLGARVGLGLDSHSPGVIYFASTLRLVRGHPDSAAPCAQRKRLRAPATTQHSCLMSLVSSHRHASPSVFALRGGAATPVRLRYGSKIQLQGDKLNTSTYLLTFLDSRSNVIETLSSISGSHEQEANDG